jgi:DNA-binding NtrC family response regulator
MGKMDGLGAHYPTGSPGRDDRWEKDGVVRQMLREALDSRRHELADFLLSQFGRDDRFQRMLLALLTASQARPAKKAPPETDSGRQRMLGESPAMRGVFAAIQKFALTDIPVLIGGETGTGKELAALAIHESSRAARGPFVVVNCGALPSSLIASELFGHEKGAFTGAHQRRIGRLEAAAGGTVLLDEIGDLPLDLQPHLLRFLQQRTIERVGGNRVIEINARVVAATNVELPKAVAEGRFRQDLYYRLNVLTMQMPPLRDRGDDVVLLAEAFLRDIAAETGRRICGIEPAALAAMRGYSWPGNVRELLSRIRGAVVVADGEWLTLGDLGLADEPPSAATPQAPPVAAGTAGRGTIIPLEQAKKEAEGAVVRAALRRHHGNVTRAAHELSVSRVTLYRLMLKYDILPRRPKAS